MAFVLLSGRAPFRVPATKQIKHRSVGLREMLVPLLDKQCHAPIYSGFHTREWYNVSKKAKSFVQVMMHPEMGNRPSAEEALNHPFLSSTGDRSESSESELRNSDLVSERVGLKALNRIMPRIEMYLTFSDLKRSVAVVVASILDREDPAALEQARRAFVTVDKDRNGELDASEFSKAINLVHMASDLITTDSAKSVLRRLNVLCGDIMEPPSESSACEHREKKNSVTSSAEDHKISYTEFIAATLDFEKYMTPYWVGKAFDVLVAHGLGFVDFDETSSLIDNGEKKSSTSGVGTSHVRIKSGAAVQKISEAIRSDQALGIKGKSTLSEHTIDRESRGNRSISVIDTTIIKLADQENTPKEDPKTSPKEMQKKLSGTFSRKKLIESICHVNAHLSHKDKSPKDLKVVSYPMIDEPNSDGDGDETSENANAKLQADLLYFASRMSSSS